MHHVAFPEDRDIVKISGNMQIWSRMKTSCCYLLSPFT